MAMWIILGALVGVVVIFLVVQSIFGRKKAKKVAAEKKELDLDIKKSGTEVSKKVLAVFAKNDERLKNFVPSIGKVKMKDINKLAKDDLLEVKNSKMYKLISNNEKEWEDFSKHLEALIIEKSNNWSKRNKDSIDFFKNYKPEEEKPIEKSKKRKK